MTDYTARNVLLKDANGNYLIPYTEKADLSLSNLNASGKAYVAIKGYDSTTTYSLNEVVMTIVSGSVLFYKSLVNNNTSALSDTTKWEAVSFGGGANVDLSNLTPTGETHFANPALTNSPYTTNRILEIPQDIKLELNNGALTLKAGSKVYVPNGFEADGTTPKFDVRIIENDIVDTTSGHNNTELLTVRYDGGFSGGQLFWFISEYIYSGATAPTVTSIYAYWYDTANNLMKWTENNGSTWETAGYSLPIALGKTNSSGATTSLDQVFNGFGYIGSTIFALQMKGEATTAINQDGTVTKTIWESTTVQTLTVSASGSVSMSSAGVLTAGFNEVGYTKLADVIYYDSRVQDVNFYDIGFVANSNASNFSKAGRSYLSGLSAPSTTYENWTLLASNNDYDIPANGWLTFVKQATGAGQYVLLFEITGSVIASYGISWSVANGNNCGVTVRVRKGQKIRAGYSATGPTQYFRFFYDVGEV